VKFCFLSKVMTKYGWLWLCCWLCSAAVHAQTLAAAPQAEITPQLPAGMRLIIPVAGVKPSELQDTFLAARSEGRTHNAIDIVAARDTPVLAAADGEVVRFVTNALGGISLYQLSADRKVVFYYAHLDHYAEGLAIGRQVKQGEVIAYVGDTGNARGTYHLHFAVWLVEDPKKYWTGVNVNPYPALRRMRPRP
jgi:murein DD-endopeptidase MepM/ murein hydrolase activator NlpD